MNENNLNDKDKYRLRIAKEHHAQIEKKLKRAVRNHEKLTKKTVEQETRLLNPNIKDNLIEWVRDKKNDKIFHGFLNDEKYFNITAGILSFTLSIINVKLRDKHYKAKTRYIYTSMELLKLQKIANNILIKFGSRP